MNQFIECFLLVSGVILVIILAVTGLGSAFSSYYRKEDGATCVGGFFAIGMMAWLFYLYQTHQPDEEIIKKEIRQVLQEGFHKMNHSED